MLVFDNWQSKKRDPLGVMISCIRWHVSQRLLIMALASSLQNSKPAIPASHRLRLTRENVNPSDLTNRSPNWDKASPSVRRLAASLSSKGTH